MTTPTGAHWGGETLHDLFPRNHSSSDTNCQSCLSTNSAINASRDREARCRTFAIRCHISAMAYPRIMLPPITRDRIMP